MYVGKYENRAVKIIDGKQKSMLITGIPGSGKSSRMQVIEHELVKAGGTAIIVDVTPAHVPGRILSEIAPQYENLVNRIDAVNDGLNISFLSAFRDEKEKEEPDFRIVDSVVSALSSSRNGYRQIGLLREIIMEAVMFKKLISAVSDIDLIKCMIEKKRDEGSDTAEALCQQLWPIFFGGIFRPSEKHVMRHRINIIDFSGADIRTAVVCAELFLSTLWRGAYYSGNVGLGKLLIVVDECQLMRLGFNSSIGTMISEGRKFGVNLALGLQSLSPLKEEERAVLDMAATKIHFQPEHGDLKRITERLKHMMGDRADRFHIRELQVGEAIAMGPLECGGYPINGAIITR